MQSVWLVVVTIAVIHQCFSKTLDDVQLGQLDWYISGKISDIIRGEVEGLSQNMTADEVDCKNRINIVADTCFECSRLTQEPQVRPVTDHLDFTKVLQKEKTQDWKKIRDNILNDIKSAIKTASDFMEEKLRFPKIKLPKVKLPSVNLKDIKIPDIDLKKMSLPKVDFSKIQIPNINLPSFDLPSIHIPSITIPKMDFGNIQIPEFRLPSIKLPKISFPKIDLGGIFRGKRSITDCKDCELFQTESRENILLKVCGSQYVNNLKSRQEYLDKLKLLNSALESDFVYNVTFDESSLNFLEMSVNLIGIDYRLSNSTVRNYNATGEKFYLIDMIRSAEVLAPKLFQDFLN